MLACNQHLPVMVGAYIEQTQLIMILTNFFGTSQWI